MSGKGRPSIQKFRKGVGGQRGLARGNPSKARDSGLFSVPYFLENFSALSFGLCLSPTPARQPLFETSVPLRPSLEAPEGEILLKRGAPNGVFHWKRLDIGRREKTPTPKTRFSIWTLLRTPGRFTTRPLRVHFTTKTSVVRPFSVLNWPLVKQAVFLARLKSWGWGSFPPFQGQRQIAQKERATHDTVFDHSDNLQVPASLFSPLQTHTRICTAPFE